jgi:SNF2 family DNA or RNA helicase
MKEWAIHDGQLTLEGSSPGSSPSADDIFRSVIEGEQRWADVRPGRHGAAVTLKFSRYPAIPRLILTRDTYGPRVDFEAQLPDGSWIALNASILRTGHTVNSGTWYPLDIETARTVLDLAAAAGMPTGDGQLSLRAILDLRKLCGNGPVEDRLALDAAAVVQFASASGATPDGVQATLYPYQTEGWRWLRFVCAERIGGLLADEMGLGKTLQIICLLSDSGGAAVLPALIVAPGSLLENWCRELARFAPTLPVLKHHGSDRSGSPAALDAYEVIVTSYDTVVRDGAMIGMREWGTVILDEAQNIRNPAATRTRAVKRLRRRAGIAVTGTPLENRLLDVWSIMDFACPDYLGTEKEFTQRYVDSPEDAAALEPLISPLILRRRVAEVARDLPQKIEIPQVLELDADAARQYEMLRSAIREEYGAAAPLVALMKLRMFCAHPDLIPGPAVAADFVKLQRLGEIAEEIFAAGEKALVFTSYTVMADTIATRLMQRFGVFAATLDGRLPIPERQPLIDQFAAVAGPAVLILNPRAGGTGLNITAANHVIHYNPEWNPALEDQASARSFRRGQTRPVTVHRLLIAGTVEEVIAERLERKRTLAAHAIVGVEGEADDLADIVSALDRSPLARKQDV